MTQLTDNPIDTQAVLAAVATPAAGAVVLFLGTTREFTDGRQTTALDYEAYRPMAEKTLSDLAEEARRRWPIEKLCIVHRLGHVPLGEASVAVAVSTAHRAAAFEAGQWLIDSLKESVPIWKKETWAVGGTEWVHPGMEPK
ncbi:MAG: molybdenum cofactor biosynthesis protein MoaE [Planctomycetes bacterium]|nr:molybdenum cofactor biosynthesis protein MoaE [Planctomycetota bacterium]